jgi:hypothetical protein
MRSNLIEDIVGLSNKRFGDGFELSLAPLIQLGTEVRRRAATHIRRRDSFGRTLVIARHVRAFRSVVLISLTATATIVDHLLRALVTLWLNRSLIPASPELRRNAGMSRIGRLQRACRRAFRAASASELPTSALMAWARPRGVTQTWQREEVCRAAKPTRPSQTSHLDQDAS